jgi:hypothetical protein
VAWKYFDPHPFWPGPRSYVVRRHEEIAAHIGHAPVRLAPPSGPVDSGQFLDWMANPRIAGSGVVAYWECLGVVDTVLVAGGSEDARRVLPKMKWVRRISDVQDTPAPCACAGRSPEWRALSIPFLSTVWTPHGNFIPIGWLNFHLKCPAVRFEAISLERNGRPAGHALLAHAGPQLRIVDFVIDIMDEVQWTQACAALIQVVAADAGSYEVAAGSSLPFLQRVFERCGLRHRTTEWRQDCLERLGGARCRAHRDNIRIPSKLELGTKLLRM